jgi:hypothetical protein
MAGRDRIDIRFGIKTLPASLFICYRVRAKGRPGKNNRCKEDPYAEKT